MISREETITRCLRLMKGAPVDSQRDRQLFDPFTDQQVRDYYIVRLGRAIQNICDAPHWDSSRKINIRAYAIEITMLAGASLTDEQVSPTWPKNIKKIGRWD